MRENIENLMKRRKTVSVIAFAMVFAVVAIAAVIGFSGGESESADEIGGVIDNVQVSTEASEELGETLGVTGYGLYIDGKFVAATAGKASVDSALDAVLARRSGDDSDSKLLSASFTNNIEVVAGAYDKDSFVTASELKVLLGLDGESSYKTQVCDYTGNACDVTLNVRTVVVNVETGVLQPDVVYVDDSNMLASQQELVKVEGSEGLTENRYQVEYINGNCVDSKFISSTVVVEPVDRVVHRGVLTDDRHVAGNGTVANSPFIMPYDGQYISSYYGWRSMGWHSGIDIIGGRGVDCYGDPIWAARDGVVIYAETMGTYGLLVRIQHADGSETRYAHLSTIKVEVGQEVKQGQIIGNIGTTGFVTGAHLHFEILINGQTVNPLKYVSLYRD